MDHEAFVDDTEGRIPERRLDNLDAQIKALWAKCTAQDAQIKQLEQRVYISSAKQKNTRTRKHSLQQPRTTRSSRAAQSRSATDEKQSVVSSQQRKLDSLIVWLRSHGVIFSGKPGDVKAISLEGAWGQTYIRRIPPELELCSQLEILSIPNAYLREMPEEVWKMKSLTGLHMGNNRLRIPPSIQNLSSLRELNLAANMLTTLPKEIGRLQSLVKLCLNDNHLPSLPSEIRALSNLRELNVWMNQLTEISDSVCGLRSLELLAMARNRIQSVPAGICRLVSLKKLYLNDNPSIERLPPEITELKSLEYVHVWGKAGYNTDEYGIFSKKIKEMRITKVYTMLQKDRFLEWLKQFRLGEAVLSV